VAGAISRPVVEDTAGQIAIQQNTVTVSLASFKAAVVFRRKYSQTTSNAEQYGSHSSRKTSYSKMGRCGRGANAYSVSLCKHEMASDRKRKKHLRALNLGK
jgi:hypothetical protein